MFLPIQYLYLLRKLVILQISYYQSITHRNILYLFIWVSELLTLNLFCFATTLQEQSYSSMFQHIEPDGYEYLEELESLLLKSRDTNTRLGLINDLTYYYHTRDLIEADSLTVVG